MARALTPVIGMLLLVTVTILLAASVSVAATNITPNATPLNPLVLDVETNADKNQVVFVHTGGESVNVRYLTMRIEIDRTPLGYQPPIPFFSAKGYHAGPTGPFNIASDSEWAIGEVASLRIAGTNTQELESGALLTVDFYVNGTRIAVVNTRID